MINAEKNDWILIHDAARPNLSINLLRKLKNYLKNYKAVVPYLNSENSVKYTRTVS